MGEQKPRAAKVAIGEEVCGQRLDNFLIATLKGVPRSRIYRILRRGEVRVNSARVAPGYRLQKGDILRLPPIRQAAKQGAVLPRPGLAAHILYEDEAVLVLNKPAGLAVHGGSGLRGGAVESLRDAKPQWRTLELAHRLDRDTSGCLLLAKKKSVLRELHAAFREGRVEKEYLALATGRWPRNLGRVDAALRRGRLRSGERVAQADAGGRQSATRFRVIERLRAAGGLTLLKVQPETGRMHQVRAHAAHAGCPLAGDTRYGNAALNRQLRGMGLGRLFLHAAGIRLHSASISLSIEAALPEALAAFLNRLRLGAVEVQ